MYCSYAKNHYFNYFTRTVFSLILFSFDIQDAVAMLIDATAVDEFVATESVSAVEVATESAAVQQVTAKQTGIHQCTYEPFRKSLKADQVK